MRNDTPKNSSRSEVQRANLNSYYFNKAYDRDEKVVYVNALMPSEIFFALDLVPFNLGLVGGIMSQAKASTSFINLAQQHHFSVDLCSTSRCIMGSALKNALPTPDFLVIMSVPCDVGANIYYFLSQYYGKEWFLLDIPYHYDAEAVTYLEGQIASMTAVMEKALERKLDPAKLRRAIEYSNEAVLCLDRTNHLARLVPSPLSPLVSMEIASSLHLLGSPEMADVCRQRYEDIVQKVQAGESGGSAGARLPRVLWHGLRPFYTDEIFQHLMSQCRLDIISDININGGPPYHWEPLDPDDPFHSLAEKMIRLSGVGTLNQFTIPQISAKINEYSIDGIISFNSRGCRHLLSVNQVLRDIAGKNGLPFLEIDGDYIDDRDYSFEQIKTRVEAFAEILHGRI